MAGGCEPDGGPQFARPVGAGGYAWWYVDALSRDGQHGLTIIAFVGSVFSPYYAFARRRGVREAEHHCAFNVALYGAAGHRWAMTERGRTALTRDTSSLTVGPSSMRWDGTSLQIDFDEMSVPIPSRLRGSVRLKPAAVGHRTFELDNGGRHRWRPIAPIAEVDVVLSSPQLSWSGSAYFDSNWGSEPLEDGFESWHWSRSEGRDEAVIHYDVVERRGGARSLALIADADAKLAPIEQAPSTALPSTFWRISRETHADAGHRATVKKTLEDTPFYARSIVSTKLDGRPRVLMHESLDLNRFRTPIVQAMLPFRMPRRAR